MFTPEFSKEDIGEWILVASHSLENEEAVSLSIEYNIARIEFGRTQLPSTFTKCVVVYDVRGQSLPTGFLERVKVALGPYCEVRIME